MSARTRTAKKPSGCEVIEAVFVYGPNRCGVLAETQVLVEGLADGPDWFYICDEHISEGVA